MQTQYMKIIRYRSIYSPFFKKRLLVWAFFLLIKNCKIVQLRKIEYFKIYINFTMFLIKFPSSSNYPFSHILILKFLPPMTNLHGVNFVSLPTSCPLPPPDFLSRTDFHYSLKNILVFLHHSILYMGYFGK